MCEIYHIPAAFMKPTDPREQDCSGPIPDPQLPTTTQWRHLEGCEAVGRLVEEHGADRVIRWVKFQAWLQGLEVSE